MDMNFSEQSKNSTPGIFRQGYDGHSDILEVNETFKNELLAYTSFQILFFILGVTGNAFIIYVYKAKLHKKREGRFFVILLAIVDLLHCIVSSSLVFVKNLNPLTFPDKWTCKTLIFGTNWLFILSLLVLLLVCLERYLKICRPLSSQITQRLKIATSISMVIFAGVIPIPRLVYFEIRQINIGNLTGNVCGPKMDMTGADIVIPGVLYFNFILSGSVIIALVVLYALVGKVIYHHNKRLNESLSPSLYDRNDKGQSDRPNENGIEIGREETSYYDNNTCSITTICTARQMRIINRATIMFMIVTLVTILSYIPLWIYVFLDVLDPTIWFVMPEAELHFFFFLRALSVASYLSNPIIYAYYDRKFRGACCQILCGFCKRSRPSRTSNRKTSRHYDKDQIDEMQMK